MMITSDWWLRTSSKFSVQEFEEIHGNIEFMKSLKQVRIPPIMEVVNAMKSVQIVQQLAFDAVR